MIEVALFRIEGNCALTESLVAETAAACAATEVPRTVAVTRSDPTDAIRGETGATEAPCPVTRVVRAKLCVGFSPCLCVWW